MGFFFGDGAFQSFEMPNFRVLPRGGSGAFELQNAPNGGTFYFRRDSGAMSDEIRATIERAMEKARQSVDEARQQVEKIKVSTARRIATL